MSDAAFGAALGFALTGDAALLEARDLPERDADVLAALAARGWDRVAIATHAESVLAAGDVWPHEVPAALRQQVGSARLFAAVRSAQAGLGLFGHAVPRAPARVLNADERRLLADVPPHHGN